MQTITKTQAQQMAQSETTQTEVQLSERLMAAIEYERACSQTEEPVQVTWRRDKWERQVLLWRRGSASNADDVLLENPENQVTQIMPFTEVFLPAAVALRLEKVARTMQFARSEGQLQANRRARKASHWNARHL